MKRKSQSIAMRLFRCIPARLREQAKRLLVSDGHRGGVLDEWRAMRLAKGSKKASQLSRFCKGRILDVVGGSLEGSAVMEYGAGFLMAEPLIYSMYGAGRIDAVDYNPVLRRKVLRHYAMHSDWTEAMKVAASVMGSQKVLDWKSRLDRALMDPSEDWFEALGIHYIAPYDVTTMEKLEPSYDLIVSQSTLEHVPSAQAATILHSLGRLVKSGGKMYHYIHLEDHRDFNRDPFAFLGAMDDYEDGQADARGNRLRASEWMRILENVEGFGWDTYTHPIRSDIALPSPLLERYRTYDPEDLMTSHLTVKGFRLS